MIEMMCSIANSDIDKIFIENQESTKDMAW